ncbi:uncharacterized protein LOC112532543 [Gallus gallus]|uniref:uncharacterized protein LOC112532543 n=1 Tax=Gallus gallus TaxID=9031 RepID=UPI001AE31CF4|nr:uncharacterized protein LOC112532543 [Gallus gallus]XP_040557877.1 uncharacterized protein LOC112532543 [Gallus gallus]
MILKCFLAAVLNEFFSQSVLISGITLTQVQHLVLGLLKPCQILMGPLTNHVQVPLDGIPPLYCINCTTQHDVISKLAESTFNPTVYVVDKGNPRANKAARQPSRERLMQRVGVVWATAGDLNGLQTRTKSFDRRSQLPRSRPGRISSDRPRGSKKSRTVPSLREPSCQQSIPAALARAADAARGRCLGNGAAFMPRASRRQKGGVGSVNHVASCTVLASSRVNECFPTSYAKGKLLCDPGGVQWKSLPSLCV